MKDRRNALLLLVIFVSVSLLIPGAYFFNQGAAATSGEKWLVMMKNPSDFDLSSVPGFDVIYDYGDASLVSADISVMNKIPDDLVLSPLSERNHVYLNGYDFDVLAGEPDIPDYLRSEAPSAGEEQLYVVHMIGPIPQEWTDAVESAGGEIITYIQNNAYEVRMTQKEKETVESYDFVNWVGYYHPAYRISPNLDTGDMIEVLFTPSASYDDAVFSEARNLMNTADASSTVHGYRLTGHVSSLDDVYSLAALDEVQYIQQYSEPHLMDEMGVQIIGGGAWYMDDDNDVDTPYRAEGDYGAYVTQIGWTADGVTVGIADTGFGDGTTPNAGHNDFTGRVIGGMSYDGGAWSDGHGHGTHCAGLMAADGYNGNGVTYAGFGDYYVGMGLATEADIYAQKIFSDSGSWIGPDDDYQIPKDGYAGGARVHSNSWGADDNGDYIDSDSAYDHAARDADDTTAGNQEMVLIVAAGNSGSGSTTIGSPGNAKNVITVGAVENYMPDAGSYGNKYDSGDNPDSVTSFSSRGPTEDGRIKPDVCAPGQATLSTHSPIISGSNLYGLYSEDDRYEWCTGTSQATPTVSGAAAVVYGWYQDTYGSAPSPALVKGLLINTAVDMGTADIPNYNEGWGRVFLPTIVDSPAPFTLKNQESELTTGNTDTFEVSYVDSSQPLKITLVYTDTYAADGASVTLQNNLDLEVISPGGDTYHGNAFSAGWSDSSATPSSDWDTDGNGYDDRNNVECVYIPAGALEAGTYTINIIGANVPTDADFDGTNDQDYALVIYNGVEDQNPPDFSGIDGVSDPGTGYSLDLSWSAATDNEDSYPITYNIYRSTSSGSQDFSSPVATYTPSGVSPGDSITWSDSGLSAGTTYYYVVRAQDSFGNEETNTVERSGTPSDTQPPTFSGLQSVINIGTGTSLELSWDAAVDASTPITYYIFRSTTSGGQDFNSPVGSTTNTYFNDTGLTEGTTYYYVVRAEDSNGYRDTNTVEVSGSPFVQWWLQIEASGISGYQDLTDLSIDPIDTGAAENTLNLTAVGQYQIGSMAWISQPVSSDTDVAGDWTFNVYGYLTNTNANGHLYAKVYDYDTGSLLFQTGDDDEDVNGFTSTHMFTWTYTAPSVTVASGERIYTEIWLNITTGGGGFGTVRYDYSSGAGSTNIAYECDVDAYPPTGGNLNSQTEATPTDYSDIAASDDVRWQTIDPGTWDEPFLWMEMTISEDPATVTQLDFYFEGYNPTGYELDLYMYNVAAGDWESTALASVTSNAGSDTTLTASITSSITDYIDSNGKVTWGIYSADSSDSLYIDYVYMDVKYGTPSAQFVLRYDAPATDSNVIPSLTATPPTMTVSFATGWNLISLPWLTDPTDINDALNGLDWSRAMVYRNGQWYTYNKDRDAKFNTGFPMVDNTAGIWVYASSSGSITENEPSITSTDILLNEGWNLIGYPSHTSGTVSDLMSGFTGAYDIVQRYDPATGDIVDLSAADNMEYGVGYWVHVTSAGTLTVNW